VNRDPYEEMMRDVVYVIGALVFAAFVSALVFLGGCTQHKVDVSSSTADKLIASLAACPKVSLPPIADDVVIDIKGDKITTNPGGEQLLRGYVQCRLLYR